MQSLQERYNLLYQALHGLLEKADESKKKHGIIEDSMLAKLLGRESLEVSLVDALFILRQLEALKKEDDVRQALLF